MSVEPFPDTAGGVDVKSHRRPCGFPPVLWERLLACTGGSAAAAMADAELLGEELVELEIPGLDARVVVPSGQLCPSLANLLHTICLDEHRLAELHDTLGSVEAVIDAGAYLGFFGIHAWRLLGPRLVVAYEPNPLARRLLEENLRLNNVKAVARPEALAPEGGSARLHLAESWVNSSLDPVYARSTGLRVEEVLEVPTVGLREVLEEAPRGSILKLDIEGLEDQVLASAPPGLLREKLAAAIVEAHGALSAGRVAALLKRAGMRCSHWRLPGTSQYIVQCVA